MPRRAGDCSPYVLCVLSRRTEIACFQAALGFIVLAVVACGRPGEPPPANRESAYQSNNRGVSLLEQFRYEDAAAAFREAMARDGTLAIARINLSLALLYAQDFDAAEREATEAARLLPSAAQPPYILGLVARAENRNEDAIRFFERVRQIDSRDVFTKVHLGQISLQNRQYEQAVKVLREAAADEPYNVTAVYNLGLALTRMEQRTEGQQMLDRSQALRDSGYGVAVGTGYLEQGPYAEAVLSTGAEPELIDPAPPAATFTPVALGSAARPGATATSPFGRRFAAGELTAEGERAIAAALGGGLTLIDFDRDADLDLFVAWPEGQRLMRNDGGSAWIDVTSASGLGSVPSAAVPIGCVAGDYDNDGMTDLFVLRYGGSSLYHNDGAGRFRDVTGPARLPSYPFLGGAAAFVDVDHDGDLDLVVAGLADFAATRAADRGNTMAFPRDFAPAPIQLLRNNGNGTFADVTRAASLQASTRAIAIVPTDFDNRRDIDLLFVNHTARPVLFKNLRDGTFRDVAAEVGLGALVGPDDEVAAVAAGDVNKDDIPDFFVARASGGVFALSDSRGQFTVGPAPDGTRLAVASQFFDYDNDGLLDLLTWTSGGPRMFRNLGRQWSDVTNAAIPGSGGGAAPQFMSARVLALADLNSDGNTDFVTGGSGPLSLWRSSGDRRHRSFGVQLTGRVSNRLGVGSKVQLRSGSLSERRETSAATPAVGPADIVFGLGRRERADAIRVLWPSGVLQAEAAAAPDAGTGNLPSRLTIEELNRKPSSCPFLFTWNGERFEFVTDFMGGGEIGYWEGPGRFNSPDPVEYVRIRGDQLRPNGGRLDIRVTNELEETVFVDRLQLWTIAHPGDIDVFPNEGLTHPPKPFRLYAVRDKRIPARVSDDRGHDVTAAVAHLDRRYPDDFEPAPFRGYAAEHALTIDLGAASGPDVLLLTGWTDYAFSSDNVAAHQAGRSLVAPSLQVKDAAGGWRTAIADFGIPVGRPQTIVVDLAGHLRPGERELRIVTNMRIYWDQILVARAQRAASLRVAPVDPQVAMLGPRGFSAEVRPDGNEPASYDYERVTLQSPWKAMYGYFTREGDVRPLVTASDDMFVVAKPGDQLVLGFDAPADSLPPGWVRTFLLMADGFSKEMDINSASPDTVEPLPFHGMTRYPYPASEQYPDTPAHRDYRQTYNTRKVARSLPLLIAPGQP